MQYVCLQVPSYKVGWRRSMLAAAAAFAGLIFPIGWILFTALRHRKEACVNVKKKPQKTMVVVQQTRENQFLVARAAFIIACVQYSSLAISYQKVMPIWEARNVACHGDVPPKWNLNWACLHKYKSSAHCALECELPNWSPAILSRGVARVLRLRRQ